MIYYKKFLTIMSSASIVKRVAESNCLANIVNDRELRTIFTAGQLHIVIPSVFTISQDINASFAKCRKKMGKMLKVSVVISLFSAGGTNQVQGLFWAPPFCN
jgi:hypothetical protein